MKRCFLGLEEGELSIAYIISYDSFSYHMVVLIKYTKKPLVLKGRKFMISYIGRYHIIHIEKSST